MSAVNFLITITALVMVIFQYKFKKKLKEVAIMLFYK